MKLRDAAAISLVAVFAGCAMGREPSPAQSDTRLVGSSGSAPCRPARSAASPIMWSCIIAPGTAPIVHGLSGIYYDRTRSILWAASDDDVSYPGDPARLLRFRLTATPSLILDGTLSLTRPANAEGAVGQRQWQLEAIAPVIDNGVWKGAFFVATEHDALSAGFSSQIYRCAATGRCDAPLLMPRELESMTGSMTGLQDNQGLEGLTTSPDGARLFAAVERSLAQEKPAAGARERVRLIEYTTYGSRTPVRQYAYALDPAPADMDGGGPGVSEIHALSPDRLLVLERSYYPACGNTIRLFQITLDPALAMSPGGSIAQAVPLQKQLLIDLTDERVAFDEPKLAATLENFEGMTLGPDLPDGSRTLLLVTDDNRRSSQITAVVSVNMSSLPTAAARRWRDGDLPACPRQP